MVLRGILNIMKKIIRYKGIKIGAFGLPTTGEEQKKTKRRDPRIYRKMFTSPFNKNSPKNLIIMYDIPDRRKSEREWFRRQLQYFGYVMIQRSVWVGPSPLPRSFVSYLKSVKLRDKLKTFKLARPYKEGSPQSIK